MYLIAGALGMFVLVGVLFFVFNAVTSFSTKK
jgi:hypothetical protein